jgi:hypothetical protein
MANIFYPKTIVQYAEYPELNISWTNNFNSDILDNPNYNFAEPGQSSGSKNVLSTIAPLTHVANPTRGPKLDKTYYLKCTDFRIQELPNTITGITLTLSTQRNQKIVDETICLLYNDQIISDNKTNLSAGPYSIDGHMNIQNVSTYGGPTDMWGSTTITKTMLMDPGFGVLLRFASNPMYPHKEGMLLYQITLEISPDNYFSLDTGDVEFITEDALDDQVFVNE